jgi:hypothetical protein
MSLHKTAIPYTVTRPYAKFCHPDRMAPDQKVRGEEQCWKTFLEFSGDLLCEKKSVSRKNQTHILRSNDPVLNP